MPCPNGKPISLLPFLQKSISLIAKRSLIGRKSKPDRYTFRETNKKWVLELMCK